MSGAPAPDPAVDPRAPAYDAALERARAATRAFVADLPRASRVVVFCHFDADGLAAGAVAGRALPRLGFGDVTVVPSGKGESAFGDAARARLAALRPDALVVTDLGVNAAGVLADVPTLYVDHHQPVGTPAPPATIATGYGWDPVPTSAWLMWELLAPLADAAGTPIDDLLWIAAIGTISDLGAKAPWPRLDAIRRQYTAKWLKEAVSLVNAARRASAFDVATPLALLMTAEHPRAVSEDEAGGADRLRAYRAEVNAALAEARKRAPIFAAPDSPWALVPVASACQIHPLIAQQWRGRLPKHAVMGVNPRYVPERVAFSCRTSRAELDLPALLRGAVDLGPWNAHFGNGHDHASGGQLPPAEFDRLLAALGFDAPARSVAVGG